MSHKQIPQVDAEIVEKCRFHPLLVVFFTAQYGKSPIELFKEEKTTHLMGQCESGKGKDLAGLIQKFLGQAQRATDDKADPPSRAGGEAIQPGRQLSGIKRVPRTIERNPIIPGRQLSRDGLSLYAENLFFRPAFLDLGWLDFNPFHLDIFSEPLQVERFSRFEEGGSGSINDDDFQLEHVIPPFPSGRCGANLPILK